MPTCIIDGCSDWASQEGALCVVHTGVSQTNVTGANERPPLLPHSWGETIQGEISGAWFSTCQRCGFTATTDRPPIIGGAETCVPVAQPVNASPTVGHVWIENGIGGSNLYHWVCDRCGDEVSTTMSILPQADEGQPCQPMAQPDLNHDWVLARILPNGTTVFRCRFCSEQSMDADPGWTNTPPLGRCAARVETPLTTVQPVFDYVSVLRRCRACGFEVIIPAASSEEALRQATRFLEGPPGTPEHELMEHSCSPRPRRTGWQRLLTDEDE